MKGLEAKRRRFFEKIPKETQVTKFEWRGRSVELVVCESEADIPDKLVFEGSFLPLARDGVFVEISQEAISIYDCRTVFEMKVEEEEQQEFIDRLLDERLEGDSPRSVIFPID